MVGIVTVRQTEFADFEALRDAVQDSPSEIVQLEHGKMTGTLAHLSVGSVGISTGSFTRGVRQRGVLSPNRWTLGMLLGSPALLQHFEAGPGDLFVLAPDHELYSRFIDGNHYAATLISPDELFAFLDSQQPGAADAALWQQSTSVLSAAPAIAALRAQNFQTLLAAMRTHGPTMSDGAADFFKRSILELMTAPVLQGSHDYRGPRLQQSKVQLVRDVDCYLHKAGNRPVHITKLTEKFKVHRRTLHRAFIDVLGIGPITFLRRKRLGDVHKVLVQGGPDAMIKAVAIEHGFLQLGRFAGEYRQLFGEKPSQTLRRAQR
jgi:AraC-like DNA-binding protein